MLCMCIIKPLNCVMLGAGGCQGQGQPALYGELQASLHSETLLSTKASGANRMAPHLKALATKSGILVQL